MVYLTKPIPDEDPWIATGRTRFADLAIGQRASGEKGL